MRQVELVEYVVKSLVDFPEEVKIDEIRTENASVLELRVHPEDLGKVIGKNGRIAKSLRSLMLAAEGDANRDFILEIID